MAHIDHAEANRQHFNETAHSYDAIPLVTEITAKSANAMRAMFDFDEESTVAMDFACGTGLVSQNLATYCKQIVGVDVSEGMVGYYNMRVSNQGIPPEEMRAVCTVLKGEEGELDNQKFDVIVCHQAYHHFASIESVTRILTSFLKHNGVLLVVDLIRGEHTQKLHQASGSGHAEHIVAHKGGFNESEIIEVFKSAGLDGIEFKVAAEFSAHGHEEAKLQLFIAKGIRSLTV